MRRFLYFLPGVPGGNRQMLSDRGLLSRFRKFGGELVEHAYTQCLSGPGGRSGCIVAAGPAHVGAEFSNTGQRWIEGEKFWVGIEDVNDVPGPAAGGGLVREVLHEGATICLGDGNMWETPRLRRWDPQRLELLNVLPQRLAAVSGKAVMKVAPEYAGLDALAEEIWAGYLESRVLPLEKAFAMAVHLLSANYRVGMEEASLLGLFDEVTAQGVLAAAIDLPAVAAQAAELAMQGLKAPEEPVIQKEESC